MRIHRVTDALTVGKIPQPAEFSAHRRHQTLFSRLFTGIFHGTVLAVGKGMTRGLPQFSVLIAVLSMLTAPALGATAPMSVDVDSARDKAYTVDAAFDVNVPPSIAWEVLTDYEGIGRFVSSIRHSAIKRREPGRVLLEQHGVGRAWIISVPMHVVLDVQEHDERVLVFRDVCGKSFTRYEGVWELTAIAGGTHVAYRLKADPAGRQPAMLAKSAIRGSVKRLLVEVRNEILARATR